MAALLLGMGPGLIAGGAWAQASGGLAVISNGGTGGLGGAGNGGGAVGGSVGEFPGLAGLPTSGGQGGAGRNGAAGPGGLGGAVGATSVTGSVTGGSGFSGAPDPDPVYGAGGGGGGGAAVYTSDIGISVGSSTVLQGGNGGSGGIARLSGGGGGGGAGLQSVAAGVTLNNAGQTIGGNGGAGGLGQWAGGGGGGGDGIVLQGGGATVVNLGTSTGGNGGAGGSTGGMPAFGGEGGAGLALQSSNNSVSNTGTLRGGSGGAGGTAALFGVGGAALRVWGHSNTIVNMGALTAGMAGDGTTLGDAVRITGNDNQLELRAGSSITGALRVALGTGNVLRLSGDTTDSTTSLSTATYSGFARYEKTGASTWTLIGTHTGLTPWFVRGGALSIADDRALGNSGGALTLDGGTLNVTGDTTATRTVSLGAGGGTLDVIRTLALNGEVSGGALQKTGPGTLTLSGVNTYTGGTRLLAGRINVGSNSALGTGALDMADGTTLGFAANGLNLANAIVLSGVGDPVVDTGTFDGTLSGAITGTGFLTKEGTGTLTLAGANNYSGPTTVSAGTLAAGAANTLSALSSVTVASGATLNLAGFSQRIAGLANAGTVSLSGAAPGTTLTVTGPWVGNNGVLRLGTALGNSGSATDKILLSGASAVASGSTRVQVTNLGGLGAPTTGHGIEIVGTENGASIQPGAFSLVGTVSAGAYDYRLHVTDGAAYLSSATDVVTPPEVRGPMPTPAAVPTYRAEAPLLAAAPEQLREAGLAMIGNLHQRVGDPVSSSTASAGPRQGWGRLISVDRDISQEGMVSPRSSGRQSGVQVGTDLWGNPNWRAGVYVGQLEGEMDVTGFARGVQNYAAGSNDLRSQFLAGYATWRNDGGAYVDAALQAGRLRYTAAPSLASAASGKGNSVLASVELGQALPVATGWTVEPQLQLVGQHLSLDDLSLAGATVRQDNDTAWLARIGVRVKGEIASGAGWLQPYARLNVYRRSSGTDTARFIGPAATTDIGSRTGGTSTELAVGATWQITRLVAAYLEAGRLWASGGAAQTEGAVGGSLGLKVNW